MEAEKLYFKSIDDNFCSSLESHIADAISEDLDEITLIEAIPDNDNLDYIWCTHVGEVTERSDCKKSVCHFYETKSGRGKCKNRGSFFMHGEEVKFQIPLKE
jgi:hypothetical protein